MKLRLHTLLLTMLIVMGVQALVCSPVLARQDADFRYKQQVETMSLDQAVSQVQRQTNGRILSATASKRNHSTIYRIKVLMPSGHVRIFHVNAANGSMR